MARGLGLALEPAHQQPPRLGVIGAEHLGPDQLDRGGPGQQPVLGAPDFAHAAPAEPLHQPIAAELAGLPHGGAEAGDHPRLPIRHQQDHQVGEHQVEEELLAPERDVHAESGVQGVAGRHRGERQRGDDHGHPRRGGHRDTEQHHPHRDPGEPEATGTVLPVHDRRADVVVLRRRDADAGQNFEGQARPGS